MPTFARLVGAILLAAVGGYAAYLAKAHLPEGLSADRFVPVSVAIGGLVGWLFTGRHLERGKGKSIAIGVGSVILLVLWVSFLFAVEEMVDRSMRNIYRGSPSEAVKDVFAIMLEHTELMQMDVLIALGGGALVVGVVTGLVGRYTR